MRLSLPCFSYGVTAFSVLWLRGQRDAIPDVLAWIVTHFVIMFVSFIPAFVVMFFSGNYYLSMIAWILLASVMFVAEKKLQYLRRSVTLILESVTKSKA
jgi:hypothetical protein